MGVQHDGLNYEDVRDARGNQSGSRATFSDVHLEADHVTEIHRTLETDHTTTEVELPGLVNVYLVIDGGRVLIDQLSGSKVAEAIQAARQSQSDAQTATAEQTPPAQTTGEQ